MPHSQDRGAPQHHNSNKTRAEISKSHRADKPRDDLSGAFAGDENEGPAKDPKSDHAHSTNVKSRNNDQSKDKTPKI